MSNEKRVQQIRDAARYKYPDERIHFIDGAKWSDENPAWINIEDRLPDKGEDVLVTIAGSDDVMEGFYRGRNWQRKAHVFHCYKDGNLWYNITHWMPLPAAPRKEE